MTRCLSSPNPTENIRSESGDSRKYNMAENMDKVVVLLSTYNGEKYLEEQLLSLQLYRSSATSNRKGLS